MFGFSGFLDLKLYINRIIVQIRIVKLEIATAGLVVNLKKAIMRDTAIPPPPMPATVQRAIMNAKVNKPAISLSSGGMTALWLHILDSVTPQTKNG